ncbi:uncharacterized protein LOC131250775 isoform X2 [Magnolia sinica]|uniref:uncharacterized protein LOC131250775 isoform X2 n=1 Tax=Magnolia sinica TaxID=86752 RepID=UPI0026581B65|nr:uncharacterized protein LOC131250775 isoform X2 [Magnolia sinica]
MNTALINGHFREQCLKSSMERLHKELERMKSENLTSLLPQDEHHSDPAFQGLQRELLQLHTAVEMHWKGYLHWKLSSRKHCKQRKNRAFIFRGRL